VLSVRFMKILLLGSMHYSPIQLLKACRSVKNDAWWRLRTHISIFMLTYLNQHSCEVTERSKTVLRLRTLIQSTSLVVCGYRFESHSQHFADILLISFNFSGIQNQHARLGKIDILCFFVIESTKGYTFLGVIELAFFFTFFSEIDFLPFYFAIWANMRFW